MPCPLPSADSAPAGHRPAQPEQRQPRARRAPAGLTKETPMIGRITGILLEKTPPIVCIDVAGAGYEVDVPMSTWTNLPETGPTVTPYTHHTVPATTGNPTGRKQQ